MNKIFRLSLLTFSITSLYFAQAWTQEEEPNEPEQVKLELNEADSKELFDVLNKWKLVVIDRETQTKKIKTSEVVCIENMEEGRQLGCTVYDDLHSRDVTKYNKSADPLFKVLIKHTQMECEDDSETCILTSEKMACTLSDAKYTCSLEVLVQQPKNKKREIQNEITTY